MSSTVKNVVREARIELDGGKSRNGVDFSSRQQQKSSYASGSQTARSIRRLKQDGFSRASRARSPRGRKQLPTTQKSRVHQTRPVVQRISVMDQWMDDLHYEQTDYQRVLNECSEQLDAIERYTEKVDTYGNPNPTQTAVCCDILRKLQLNVGRFHKSFQPLIHELASSIYSGYPENLQVNQRQQKPASVDGKIAYSTINTIKDALASSASLSSSPPAPVVPYFELARREQVKMKKLSNMIDELTIKRSEMERQESGRIHMLNALARRWQVSLMILSFSRWKKNVQKIKSQRQGFENVSRRSKIARLRALFLQWQTSIISEKRQHLQMRNTRLQNANKLLRNSLDEHMGVLQMSNDRQTMLGDKLAQLMEDKSGYRRKVRDLQAELKGMASSAITRLTSTTLDVLLQGLNSLMIELVAARELKIEDPCQLLSKDNSEFVIAFHGDDPAVYNIDTGSAEWAMKRHTEVVRARNKLRSFSESDIVLLWMNYHLRRAEADYSAKEARGLAEKEAESRISSKAEEHSPHHHEAYHGHHPQSTLTKKSGKKHRAHKQKHHKRQRRKTIDFNRFLQHDASSSMNYQRRVSNFTSHLQDSECLLRLTHRIFPSIKEQTIHEAMIHIDLDLRARSTLDIIKRQNPESAATASILQPHYIVNATHPDLVACFVTKLCADHFSVPLEGPWFQKTHPVNVKAKKKATESKSSSFSSDDILDTDDEDNHGTGHGSGSGGSGNGHTKGSGGGASEDVSDKSSRGNKIKDCERYGPLSQMIDEVAAIKSALDKSARVQRRVITEVPNRVPVMMERARNVLSDAYERYEVWKRIKARLRGLTLKLFMRRIDKKPLIMIDYKLIKKMLRWTNFLTASGSPLSFLHDMASMTAILPSASIASSLSSSSTDSSSSSSGGGKAGSHRSHSLSATPSASTSSSSFSKGDGSESASQRLALELIRCKKIIYMYFAEIRDVWQLYAQIDAQVTVKGGAVQNANKMNALEFWRLVSDIKISSKTFKAKDIYKLFTLVLKHRRKNSRGERGKNIGKEMRKSILLNYQRENNQDKSKPVSMSVLKDDHYGPVQAASGQPISGLHSDDEDGKGHYRSSSSTGAGPSTSRALCAKEDSEIDEAQFMELLVRIAGSLVITPSLRKQTYSEYRNLLNEFSDYENNHLELGPVLQAPEMRKADLLPVSTFLASSSSSLAPSGKDIPLSIRFFALIKLRLLFYGKTHDKAGFREQYLKSKTTKVFYHNRIILQNTFQHYAVLHTVKTNKIDGELQAVWTNTMDYSEFFQLMKDSHLLNQSYLDTAALYSIFANVQQDFHVDQNESYETSSALHMDKNKRDFRNPSRRKSQFQEPIIERESNADKELVYPEFLEALAAVAIYRYPDPYQPVHVRVQTFLSNDLIPWLNLQRFSRASLKTHDATSSAYRASVKTASASASTTSVPASSSNAAPAVLTDNKTSI